jgi:hypothetical protein
VVAKPCSFQPVTVSRPVACETEAEAEAEEEGWSQEEIDVDVVYKR